MGPFIFITEIPYRPSILLRRALKTCIVTFVIQTL